MTRHNKWLVAAAAVLALVPAVIRAQDPAIQEFQRRVNDYMDFRSDFLDNVPPLQFVGDPATVEASSDILAGSLRAARPEAKLGDIFAPDVAITFRQRIHDALRHQGRAPEDLLREILRQVPTVPSNLAVNARFDWLTAATLPASLVGALPTLPNELQYRFVGAALVLVDCDARLIVDILPLALGVE